MKILVWINVYYLLKSLLSVCNARAQWGCRARRWVEARVGCEGE